MIESLTHTQSKLYSRAVEPAVESHLRTRDIRITPPASHDVHTRQTRSHEERHPPSPKAHSARDQDQVEQRAKDVAEQLSQAVREARQTSGRHKSTFSLTSHTGRQANQSYLNGGQAKEMRIVDELA